MVGRMINIYPGGKLDPLTTDKEKDDDVWRAMMISFFSQCQDAKMPREGKLDPLFASSHR